MRKICLMLILLIPTNAMAADFDAFLKTWFADPEFQKSHITYPIMGHVRFLCDSNPQGLCDEPTSFGGDPSEWTYIGYGYGTPGVVYKKSKNCPTNLPRATGCIYVELSQPDTCFNLQLYFKEMSDTWSLIYLWYFEP